MVEKFAKEVDVHSMERMLIRLRKYTDMVKKMKNDIEMEEYAQDIESQAVAQGRVSLSKNTHKQ
jgi:DNA polymerase III sliding clamp (beta) subunit (PCNA family)